MKQQTLLRTAFCFAILSIAALFLALPSQSYAESHAEQSNKISQFLKEYINSHGNICNDDCREFVSIMAPALSGAVADSLHGKKGDIKGRATAVVGAIISMMLNEVKAQYVQRNGGGVLAFTIPLGGSSYDSVTAVETQKPYIPSAIPTSELVARVLSKEDIKRMEASVDKVVRQFDDLKIEFLARRLDRDMQIAEKFLFSAFLSDFVGQNHAFQPSQNNPDMDDMIRNFATTGNLAGKKPFVDHGEITATAKK